MAVEGRGPARALIVPCLPRERMGPHIIARRSMHFEQERSGESHWPLQNKPQPNDKILSTQQKQPPQQIHNPHLSSAFPSMPHSSQNKTMNFLKDNVRDEQRLVPNWLLLDNSDSHRLPRPSAWKVRDEDNASISPPSKLPPPYFTQSSKYPPTFSQSPFSISQRSAPVDFPPRFSPLVTPSPYRSHDTQHADDFYRRPEGSYSRSEPPPPHSSRLPFDPTRQPFTRDSYHESSESNTDLPFSSRSSFHHSNRPSAQIDHRFPPRDSAFPARGEPHYSSHESLFPSSVSSRDSRYPPSDPRYSSSHDSRHSYPRQYDTHGLPPYPRSDMDPRRGSPENELRRTGSDPDVTEYGREYTPARRSEFQRGDSGRKDAHPLRHSLSPSTSPSRSPPLSPYKRIDPSLSFTPAASNVASFSSLPKYSTSFLRDQQRADSRSRSPSPTRIANPSASAPRSPSHGPPSPIFTMENFGIQSDGTRLSYPHPKNPVKFEFKDFKENEYNLHNLQNSSGGASLLSIKQQKRHKRIINRALAQGQARARALAKGGEYEEAREGTDDNNNGSKRRRKSSVSSVDSGSEKRAQTHTPGEQQQQQQQQHYLQQQQQSDRYSRRKPRTASDVQSPAINERERRADIARQNEMEDNSGSSDMEEEKEARKSVKRTLQNSSDAMFEQFKSYEELQRNMVSKPTLRSSARIRTKGTIGRSGPVYCTCNRPETNSMIQCDSCDKWYHFECVNMTEEVAQDMMQYFCMECRGRGSLVKKARIEDLIAESDQPALGAASPNASPSSAHTSSSGGLSPPLSPKDGEDMDSETWEDEGVQVGEDTVSLSSLAKQPWLDGWVTARSLAVRYLQEAKNMGYEITENRRLPKQGIVRMSGKGKRAWRQAEILLAIHFLKSADLVETSTKKGTLVREPSKTIDDLIARTQSVVMSNRANIGKVKVVEFARPKNQMMYEKELEREREKEEKERKKEEKERRREERERKEREARVKEKEGNGKGGEEQKLYEKKEEEEKGEQSCKPQHQMANEKEINNEREIEKDVNEGKVGNGNTNNFSTGPQEKERVEKQGEEKKEQQLEDKSE